MTGIEVLAPTDGRVIGHYQAADAADVARAVEAARRAGALWARKSLAERLAAVAELRRLILARTDDIVARICEVTGKVATDALLGELYPVLDLMRYYEREAPGILAPRRVPTPALAFPFARARVEQRPHGVVAIIAPWNYPFQLAVIPAITALIAGNSVCLKPSELSLPIGDLIAELFDRVEPLRGLLQVLPGAAATGRWLIEAGPDLVFFTGSAATGRDVMRTAARGPIPVVLELGGKDPLLVFADAPFERAVRAAVYGAFLNAGQVCIAVERAFVERAIYPRFVDAVVAATRCLRVGPEGDVGAISSAAQIEIIEAHYRDAIAKGAKASGPLRHEGNYIHPVVLWDVTPDMRLMNEETFGPLLPIMAFSDEAEAVRLANASSFGLNGSIFTSDLARAERVAAELQLGGCAINDVIKNVGHPGLPFGGNKGSGFGRYHGPEGLLTFSRPVSILFNSGRMATEPNWFPYGPARYRQLRGFLDFVFSEDPWLVRFRRNRAALLGFREFFTFNLRQRLHKP